MIHTGPSPGVIGFRGIACAVERAVAEARLYAEYGVDGLLIENMHDVPAVPERAMGPEVSAFMTRVAAAVKRRVGWMPVGIRVRSQANKTALAVAYAAGCDFIRAEGWTHAQASERVIAEAGAGEALRYRKAIGAEHIAVYADIRKRRTAPTWTPGLSAEELVQAAALYHADGLVVTGSSTGEAPDLEDLAEVAEVTDLPLYVGSGLTAENFDQYADLADGFIVGSAFKENGDWRAPVCETRVRQIIRAVEYARGQEVSGQ